MASKRLTDRARVLEALEMSKEGVSSYELNKLCFRYSARIFELRKMGFIIDTIPGKRGLDYAIFKLVAYPGEPKQLELGVI